MFNRHKKRLKSVNLTDFYSEELKNNAEKVLKQRISSLKDESGKENSSKLSESEIMKALECCGDNAVRCFECPFMRKDSCTAELLKEASELINSQNAEIEGLKKIINTSAIILPARKCGKTFLIKTTIEKITESARTAARAEAIKEFWNNRPERLNEQCKGKEEFHKGWNACLDEFWDIRNHLLKEMGVEL